MINIIKEWTASKSTKDFNYDDALSTLIKEKIIKNQDISKSIHFDFSINEIIDKFDAIEELNQDYTKEILELVNTYSYYLNINTKLQNYDDVNIEKLNQLNNILDNDFVDFLDRYLHLDKTILSSKDSLKIKNNYKGAIKYYLMCDFKFSINSLVNFFKSNTKATNSLKVTDKELTNSTILKPKTKAYLKPLSQRAILKCLYFDLLYCFDEITKEQAIDIIQNFFIAFFEDEVKRHEAIKKLQKLKIQNGKEINQNQILKNDYKILNIKDPKHTLTAKDIQLIKGKNLFKQENYNQISTHLKELLNTKEALRDNYQPLATISTYSTNSTK